jgi:hypothetical protein
MKHIKTFEGYVNESVNPLNEATVFVSDAKFKDEATLKADILANAGPAFGTFLKAKGVDWPTAITIEERGNRLTLTTKPVTGKDLGVMQYGFKEVYLTFFGGGTLPKIQKATAEDGSDFEFEPSIWCRLNYSYNHGSESTSSQGSNGCSFFLPGTDNADVWYDIVNGVWLDRKEAQKAGF